MNAPNGFLLYKDLCAELLEDYTAEEKGLVFDAVIRFAVNGEEPDLPRDLKFIARRLCDGIRRSQEEYEKRSARNTKNIRNRWGGECGEVVQSGNTTLYEENTVVQSGTVNQNQNVIQNVIQNENLDAREDTRTEEREDGGVRGGVTTPCRSSGPNSAGVSAPSGSPSGTKSARFRPPTVEEVREYCAERANRVDPQTFVDFYAAKGWLVGKSPMKDWRACIRTWEQREGARASPVGAARSVYNPFLDMRPDAVASGGDVV